MKRSHLLTILFAASALTANAGLIGTNVTLNYHLDGTTTTDLITVDAGTEVQCTGGGSGNANICSFLTAPDQFIDFDDFTITYNYVQNGGVGHFNATDPNVFEFLDVNPGNDIVDVILTSTIVGLDASRLTFTANSIRLNMYDLPLAEKDTFSMRIVTNPEPSAGLLGGVGVLLLGVPAYLKRRRQARSNTDLT